MFGYDNVPAVWFWFYLKMVGVNENKVKTLIHEKSN